MKRLSKQITLGYDPVTGNRIRKRIYADSPAGLRQAEKDMNTAYAKHGAPSAITYKQYLDKWWIAYCGTLSPHTQYCYKSVLKNMDTLNYVRMSKITRTDLQAILNDLWDRPNLCRKLCGLMHQIFRSAAFDGVIEKDISQGLKRPKLPKTSRRAFTEAELDAIKKVVLPERDRFLVDLMLQFGLRPAEALALNVHDFDRKACRVLRKQTEHHGVMRDRLLDGRCGIIDAAFRCELDHIACCRFIRCPVIIIKRDS